MLVFIGLIMTIIFPLAANASTVDSGTFGSGLSWTLNSEGTLTISGYGDMPDYQHPWSSHCEEIKAVVICEGITKIGSSAFYYYPYSGFTSVSIPESVTYIGSMAFNNCWGLTSVTISEHVTYIGNEAFCYCNQLSAINVSGNNSNYASVDGVLYNKDITNLIAYPAGKADLAFSVPDTVATIADEAFYSCRNIISIVLPEGLTDLGKSTFALCYNLEQVTFPDELKTIKQLAFTYCGNLTEVILPAHLETLGRQAFYQTGLSTIVLPDTLKTIEAEALRATNLTEVVIPEGVTSIATDAFSPQSVTLHVYEGSYAEDFAVDNHFNHEVIKKYEYEVANQQVTITRYLGEETEVILPLRLGGNPVTGIAGGAFSECGFIEEITIGDHITTIGSGALPQNTGLKVLCHKNSAALNYAINNGYQYEIIRKIVSSGTCGTDATWTLDDEDCLVISGTGEIASNGSSAMGQYGSNFTKLIIEEGITGIQYGAFSGRTRLTEVTLPDSLNSIDFSAFANCTGLLSLILPDEITSIRNIYQANEIIRYVNPDSATAETISKTNYSFRIDGYLCDLQYIYDGEENLGLALKGVSYDAETIIVPDIVTRIESPGFYAGSGKPNSITTIYLPDGITYVYSVAFNGCSAIRYVNPESITARTMSKTNIGFRMQNTGCNVKYLFDDEDEIAEVVVTDVPSSAQTLVVPNGVTCIPEAQFRNNENLKTISIPGSVKHIDKYAFQNSNLTTIVFREDGLESIGYHAFDQCSSLESIEFPGSLTTIDDGAFGNCTKLQAIEIPDGVETIGWSVFAGCTGLTTISIPTSVTSIGPNAFYVYASANHLQSVHVATCTCYAYSYITSYATLANLMVLDSPHTMVNDEGRPATCSEEGRTAGIYCSKCGTVISGYEPITRLPHTVVTDEAVPATDTEAGWTEGSHCEVCGTVIVARQVIPPLWELETEGNGIVILKFNGNETRLSIPSMINGKTVVRIGANAFEAGNCPNCIYIPQSVETISENAFAKSVTVYCHRFSEAQFWADEQGYSKVLVDDTENGDFYSIQMPSGFRLECGQERQIDAVVWPITGEEVFHWTCSNPDVVSVQNGIVTAILPGSAQITLQVGAKTASIAIQAYAYPSAFELSDPDVYIVSGETLQLSVTDVVPEGADIEITWASSDSRIFEITPSGMITAKRIGSATVSATSQNGIVREGTVTSCYPVASITTDEDEYTLYLGKSQAITAYVSDGQNTYENKLIRFISSDETVVSVDQQGRMNALHPGGATISIVASNGVSKEIGITVICLNHVPVTDQAVAPTCTTSGWTEGSHCENCSTVLVAQEEIDPLGHDWEPAVYIWNETSTSVTAKRYCRNNSAHVETETAAVTYLIENISANGNATIKYETAPFTNSAFVKQQKIKPVIISIPEDEGVTANCHSSYSGNRTGISVGNSMNYYTRKATWTILYDQDNLVLTITDMNRFKTLFGDDTFTATIQGNQYILESENLLRDAGLQEPWIEFDIKESAPPGIYNVTIQITDANGALLKETNERVTVTRHSFSHHVETRMPTETEPGYEEYACSCNAVIREVFCEPLKDLSTLIIPEDVQIIEEGAFANLPCEAVIIPDGCVSLGSRAFYHCTNLKYVRLPRGIQLADDTVFEGCSNVIFDYVDAQHQ